MSLGRKHRKPEEKLLPKTVDQVMDLLIATMPTEELETLRQMPEEEVVQKTRLWQMGLRNELGLWGKNRELIDSLDQKDRWADNASHLIVMNLWRQLNALPQDVPQAHHTPPNDTAHTTPREKSPG